MLVNLALNISIDYKEFLPDRKLIPEPITSIKIIINREFIPEGASKEVDAENGLKNNLL